MSEITSPQIQYDAGVEAFRVENAGPVRRENGEEPGYTVCHPFESVKVTIDGSSAGRIVGSVSVSSAGRI